MMLWIVFFTEVFSNLEWTKLSFNKFCTPQDNVFKVNAKKSSALYYYVQVLNMNTETQEKTRIPLHKAAAVSSLLAVRSYLCGVLSKDSMKIKESKFDMEIKGPALKFHAQQPWAKLAALSCLASQSCCEDKDTAPSTPSNSGWTFMCSSGQGPWGQSPLTQFCQSCPIWALFWTPLSCYVLCHCPSLSLAIFNWFWISTRDFCVACHWA